MVLKATLARFVTKGLVQVLVGKELDRTGSLTSIVFVFVRDSLAFLPEGFFPESCGS